MKKIFLFALLLITKTFVNAQDSTHTFYYYNNEQIPLAYDFNHLNLFTTGDFDSAQIGHLGVERYIEQAYGSTEKFVKLKT